MMEKKVKDFIDEIITVCEKHNMSISHEDQQGGFIIEDFFDYNVEWLRNANFDVDQLGHADLDCADLLWASFDFEGESIASKNVIHVSTINIMHTDSPIHDWEYGFIVKLADGTELKFALCSSSNEIDKDLRMKHAIKKRKEFMEKLKNAIGGKHDERHFSSREYFRSNLLTQKQEK